MRRRFTLLTCSILLAIGLFTGPVAAADCVTTCVDPDPGTDLPVVTPAPPTTGIDGPPVEADPAFVMPGDNVQLKPESRTGVMPGDRVIPLDDQFEGNVALKAKKAF